MRPTLLVLSLWAIILSQPVLAIFNRCGSGDTCINIRECHLFGPHHTEPKKWTGDQTEGFKSRLCSREETIDTIIHKVCCPKSPSTPPSGSKRGIDLLDLEGCGPYTSERFVTSMRKDKLFKYPWMALLFNDGKFFAGGTLINKRYVLTVANSVKDSALDFVRLGEYELYRKIDCDRQGCAAEPQDIPVERTIIHEDFGSRRMVHNIALLRLAYEATMNDNVIPICLPVTPAMETDLSIYLMTGWGATEKSSYSRKLKVVKLTLLSNYECQTHLRKLAELVTLYDTQMCTDGKGVCAGDGGGPLQSVSVSGRFVQYGVLSYGPKGCNNTLRVNVFTKVKSYIDWILDNLEN